jgi:hypothetical protein
MDDINNIIDLRQEHCIFNIRLKKIKMKYTNFYLKPFGYENVSHNFTITGEIGRCLNKLSIRYELSGPLNKLIIPPLSDTPARMNRLWEGTCFELFFKLKKSNAYWEFNLSPSGDWNTYRFNDYRQGMQEENNFNILPFNVQTYPDRLRLLLEFEMDKIIPQDKAIDAAICAVTKETCGRTTYWALAHHGKQPDFHNRDGFIIEL